MRLAIGSADLGRRWVPNANFIDLLGAAYRKPLGKRRIDAGFASEKSAQERSQVFAAMDVPLSRHEHSFPAIALT
jgi:hypothetical protein